MLYIFLINIKLVKEIKIYKKIRKMDEFNKSKIKNILEDIKSSYVIREVFSFLYEKQKLSIIIYNKQL